MGADESGGYIAEPAGLIAGGSPRCRPFSACNFRYHLPVLLSQQPGDSAPGQGSSPDSPSRRR